MPLIYGRKSVEPRMEPWRTPPLTEYSLEDFPPWITRCHLLLRKDKIRPNIWPETPQDLSLRKRPACQSLSHIKCYSLLKFLAILWAVTYPEFFWANRLHLGVLPPPFRHQGWRKFLKLVSPDALKMHSLAVPVLRFLCKTFSKLRKLNNETLFSVDV